MNRLDFRKTLSILVLTGAALMTGSALTDPGNALYVHGYGYGMKGGQGTGYGMGHGMMGASVMGRMVQGYGSGFAAAQCMMGAIVRNPL